MTEHKKQYNSIAHDEGRFLAVQGQSGTEFIDTWHVRDYLGSVRAVYDITPDPEDVTSAGSQILEQNDRKGKEAKVSFLVLYLLGDNYESKRKYLNLENNSNKSEVDEQQSKVYIEEYRDKDEEINED